MDNKRLFLALISSLGHLCNTQTLRQTHAMPANRSSAERTQQTTVHNVASARRSSMEPEIS